MEARPTIEFSSHFPREKRELNTGPFRRYLPDKPDFASVGGSLPFSRLTPFAIGPVGQDSSLPITLEEGRRRGEVDERNDPQGQVDPDAEEPDGDRGTMASLGEDLR